MPPAPLEPLEEKLYQHNADTLSLCEECYRLGLRDGLEVSAKAAAMLNLSPPRKWAETLRQQMIGEIVKRKRELLNGRNE
jgi:hypothetical protein